MCDWIHAYSLPQESKTRALAFIKQVKDNTSTQDEPCVLFVLGTSPSGKSTFMKLIASEVGETKVRILSSMGKQILTQLKENKPQVVMLHNYNSTNHKSLENLLVFCFQNALPICVSSAMDLDVPKKWQVRLPRLASQQRDVHFYDKNLVNNL
jgi:energy-coupling factor transporter ATP-binding protein EcfA2